MDYAHHCLSRLTSPTDFGELQVWGKEGLTGSLVREPQLSQQTSSSVAGKQLLLQMCHF